MNEYEIDEALDAIQSYDPEFAPYAKFLADWRDTVNRNSDGWSSWKAGSSCANRLSALVKQTADLARGRGDGDDHPTHEQFRSALAPIRAAATKHKLPKPELEEPQHGHQP